MSGYHASNLEGYIQHVFRRHSYAIRINNRLIPRGGIRSGTVREMGGWSRLLERPKNGARVGGKR